ncbi:MAG: hypothetical protein H8D23_16195 [Candidatus Brocadiales bacterium]|nr:hypothetical protein [Candidatus Brocadiales bacterium]
MLHIKIQKVSTIAIISIILALFIAAVFTTGITCDILLETAVFLVFVKVLFSATRTITNTNNILNQIEDIKFLLLNKKARKSSKASDDP